MLKVVRLPYVAVTGGKFLFVACFCWLANFTASAAVPDYSDKPTPGFYIQSANQGRAPETGRPISTPTFITARRLASVSQQDLAETGDASDGDKLKAGAKEAERTKPTLPSHPLPAPLPSAQWGENAGFQWQSALRQSLAFLGIQHAFRLTTEKGSRADLKGPFFKDYFATVGQLAAWDDGDPFIVNYIGHPMMGSVTGYIQVQNDPHGISQEVSLSNRSYWKSRLKAFGWSFVYSTQFELGPVSEASLGNVGIRPYEGHKHPMAYVDLVVTPVVGTAWLVGEDTLDKYLIRQLDARINNKVARMLYRSFLNPTRSMANVLRGKYPWYRDDRGL